MHRSVVLDQYRAAADLIKQIRSRPDVTGQISDIMNESDSLQILNLDFKVSFRVDVEAPVT